MTDFKAPVTGLKTFTAGTPGVMGRLSLPENMDLSSLMTWLGTKMRDSDAAIRSRMSDMNDRKIIQNEINDLMIAFRESRSGEDQGGNWLAVKPPLDNPEGIRNSDWYAALDSGTRKQIDDVLALVHPADYVVGADTKKVYSDGSTYSWKKGDLIDADTVAKHELSEYVKPLKARVEKDKFEGALQTLGDIAKNAGSKDEIEMIELQSAISARGQLLQMVSNMIASFNETAKGIVGNVRG